MREKKLTQIAQVIARELYIEDGLIEEVASKTDLEVPKVREVLREALTGEVVETVIHMVFHQIKIACSKVGSTLLIPGFATFKHKRKRGRRYKDMLTGELRYGSNRSFLTVDMCKSLRAHFDEVAPPSDHRDLRRLSGHKSGERP